MKLWNTILRANDPADFALALGLTIAVLIALALTRRLALRLLPITQPVHGCAAGRQYRDLQALRRNGVDFAFPTRTVLLHRAQSSSGAGAGGKGEA